MSQPLVARCETPARLRELAEQAARAGGRVARAAFGGESRVRMKPDRSEVTEADLAAERAAIESLRTARPHDAFLAEEQTGAAADPSARPAQVCWVIDPIDGTRNFVRGIPWLATSVAALCDGWPVAGAIYDPLRDVCYTAHRDGGAWEGTRRLEIASAAPSTALDAATGESVRTAPVGRPSKPLIAIPSTRHESARAFVLRALDEFVVRNLGSSSLHLALVAAGRLDAALLAGCKLWDIAAGWLLVTQAGGRMTRPDGGELFPVDLARYAGQDMPCLAAAAWLHSRLVGGG
jgi:myo-inositol-1(or 4)-monophosphatase